LWMWLWLVALVVVVEAVFHLWDLLDDNILSWRSWKLLSNVKLSNCRPVWDVVLLG
jgi:hypothetical protein